jgi:histone deacetylase 1/2
MKTLRVFLAFVAAHDLELKQLDVQTTFLHGDVHLELYMKQPPGYECTLNKKFVCRLSKASYGLKQASRQWHSKLKEVLHDLGFLAMWLIPA